jgi:hypothetical protein
MIVRISMLLLTFVIVTITLLCWWIAPVGETAHRIGTVVIVAIPVILACMPTVRRNVIRIAEELNSDY